MKKKFNTIDVSDLAIIQCKDEIHNVWSTMNHHDAFKEFREIAKRTIVKNYGKRALNGLSNQFIGYAAHYIFAYCNKK